MIDKLYEELNTATDKITKDEIATFLEQDVVTKVLAEWCQESKAPWDVYLPIARMSLDLLTTMRKAEERLASFDMDFDSFDDWMSALDEMIWSLQAIVNEEAGDYTYSKENEERTAKGLVLFGKYFRSLWD